MHAPRVQGQFAWYLIRQLESFRNGLRGTQPGDTLGMQMAAMARMLPDEQAVHDVVAFIVTMEPSADRQKEAWTNN
jgi:cytochrome c553